MNPTFSLVWMAFILGGGGLRYNATPQPDLADTEVRLFTLDMRWF